jgi:hypothetical protein
MPITIHPRILLTPPTNHTLANRLSTLPTALRTHQLLALQALDERRQLPSIRIHLLEFSEMASSSEVVLAGRMILETKYGSTMGAAGSSAAVAAFVGADCAAEVAVHPGLVGEGVFGVHVGVAVWEGGGDGAEVEFLDVGVSSCGGWEEVYVHDLL